MGTKKSTISNETRMKNKIKVNLISSSITRLVSNSGRQKHYAVKNFMRPYYNNIGNMNLAAVTLEKHDADDMKTV